MPLIFRRRCAAFWAFRYHLFLEDFRCGGMFTISAGRFVARMQVAAGDQLGLRIGTTEAEKKPFPNCRRSVSSLGSLIRRQ